MAHVGNLLAVEFEDDVARLDAARLGGAALVDAGDERAVRLVEPEALGDLLGDCLDPDAEPAAMHRVVGLVDQLVNDRLRRV